jgi:hypothetical protein
VLKEVSFNARKDKPSPMHVCLRFIRPVNVKADSALGAVYCIPGKVIIMPVPHLDLNLL